MTVFTDKKMADIYLAKLFEKGKRVKIEPVTVSKSLSQNAYLWLVFTHVAFECGGSKNEYYMYYLKKFPKFKEATVYHTTELVPVTLSEFTKEQTSVFIDEVVTDARQEGIDVPDPETFRAVEMFNWYKEKGLI